MRDRWHVLWLLARYLADAAAFRLTVLRGRAVEAGGVACLAVRWQALRALAASAAASLAAWDWLAVGSRRLVAASAVAVLLSVVFALPGGSAPPPPAAVKPPPGTSAPVAPSPQQQPPPEPSPQPSPSQQPAPAPVPPPPPYTPKRMYDSVNWPSIPSDAQAVAGYVDGAYAWPQAAWNRFPGAKKLMITVYGNPWGNTVDIEPGCTTVAEAHAWIHDREARHLRPNIVYGMRSQQAEIQRVFSGHHYYLWIADWTWQAHSVPWASAVQWAEYSPSFDLSTIYDQNMWNAMQP